MLQDGRQPLRYCALALLLLSTKVPLAAADQALQVPFEYSANRNAVLLHVRINEKPAILIFDTSAAHTVLEPKILGIDPAELKPKHLSPSGGGFIDDDIGREITLQVGGRTWDKRRVAVMELSEVLSGYKESPVGVLGLDFLQEFDQVTIDLKGKTISFLGKSHAAIADGPASDLQSRFSFGQLRKLEFRGGNGHYALNGSELPRITTNSIDLESVDHIYRIRASFLKTIAVSDGQPADSVDKELLDAWARQIPLVDTILKQKDPIGSLKPIAYDLIAPKERKDLQLREELTLLWSAEPTEAKRIGATGLGPEMRFSEQLIDVQYRGLKLPADRLIAKAFLQILFLQDCASPILLGGFVIVSKPNGDYEFYLVPQSLLNEVLIENSSNSRSEFRRKVSCL
jgi:hypothetical protein